MRRIKVGEIIKMLEKDSWFLHRQKGSHRQYKHPDKKGTVTVMVNQAKFYHKCY